MSSPNERRREMFGIAQRGGFETAAAGVVVDGEGVSATLHLNDT
jgi:hypothetical protein